MSTRIFSHTHTHEHLHTQGVRPPTSAAAVAGAAAVAAAATAPATPASLVPPFRFPPRGLVNTGNSCFINSPLQALLGCAPFCGLLAKLRQVCVCVLCVWVCGCESFSMCVCTVCVFTRLADAGLCAVLWAAGKAAVSV